MGRFLITFGIILIAAGLLWPWLQKLGLGRLPGDIVVERENFRLFPPLCADRNLTAHQSRLEPLIMVDEPLTLRGDLH